MWSFLLLLLIIFDQVQVGLNENKQNNCRKPDDIIFDQRWSPFLCFACWSYGVDYLNYLMELNKFEVKWFLFVFAILVLTQV